MNCLDVTDLLDNGRYALTPAERRRVAEHRSTCKGCDLAWRGAASLQMLAAEPYPPLRTEFLSETVERIRRRRPAPKQATSRVSRVRFAVAAMAAGIAAMAFLGIADKPAQSDGGIPDSSSVALNETRNIALAIDSAEQLASAAIRIAMTGGIELEGFHGRREVQWTTDLDAGRNRLTLPIVVVSRDAARIVVQVEHDDKRQEFLLPVTVVDPGPEIASVEG